MDGLPEELQLAYEEFEQASQNFNYAEPAYVGVAIYEMQTAEEKIKAKKNSDDN